MAHGDYRYSGWEGPRPADRTARCRPSLVAALAVMLMVLSSAHAAITVVDSGSSIDGAISASAGSKSITLNAGATADLLIVGTSTEFGTGTIGGWNVTYDGNPMTWATGNGAQGNIFYLDLTQTTYTGGVATLALSWDYTAGGDLGIGWVSAQAPAPITLHSTGFSGGTNIVDLVTTTNGTFNFVNFNANKTSGGSVDAPLTQIYGNASFGSNAGGAGYEAGVNSGTNTYSWTITDPGRRNDAVAFAEGLDVTAPELAASNPLSPADEATGVSISTDLVATFNESVQLAGSGSITVTNLSGGVTVIDLSGPDPDGSASAAGADLTIVLSNDLAFSTSYAVLIGSNAVEDLAGNDFAGITNNTTWNFTTADPDTTPPTIFSLSPADNSSNALAAANLVATFSENIALTGGGSIAVTNLDDGSGLTIDLSGALPDGNGNNVTVSGTDLTIDLGNDLGLGTNYAIQISADAVEDLASTPNAFAGITDNTNWNFMVASTPTYTWIQGGADPTIWTDPLNWQGGAVPPQSEAGIKLVFSASTSGEVGTSGNKVTFGSLSVSSSFDWRSFGSYGSQQTTGIFVDSGSTNNVIVTLTGGAFMSAYYVPWNLDSDLELMGSGGIGFQGYNQDGVNGSGGVIINSGTRVQCGGTHGSEEWTYTGGVTIRSGGRFVTSHSNGQLGDGLVTIEEGGWVVAQSATMDQDVSIVLTSDGANPAVNPVCITASPSFTGEFSFDVSGVTAQEGNQWQIANATATYGAAFSVAGFTESNGVWSALINPGVFEFDESTGLLTVASVVPQGTVIVIK